MTCSLHITYTYSFLFQISACPENFVKYERSGSCYYFIKDPVDWFTGNKTCTTFSNAHLVEIDSLEEQEFLANYSQNDASKLYLHYQKEDCR